MRKTVSVSVVICTCDRPDDLKATLESLVRVAVPEGVEAELLVVDNGAEASAADIEALVRGERLPSLPVRYVREPKRGLAYARNRGMAETQGELLLMTDDDVRPDPGWLSGMCAPLLAGKADYVAGGIRLSPEVRQAWMEPVHRALLASTQDIREPSELPCMIGANMAFRRAVLQKVPAFDVEIGAGTPYGGGEEALFSFQLQEAGFRRADALDIQVVHCCDIARLERKAFRQRMERYGKELAYRVYHWEHKPVGHVRRNIVRSYLKLVQTRRQAARSWLGKGMDPREMKAIEVYSFYRQYAKERSRPRFYDKCGLVKRHGLLPNGRTA
jgi:glycosyltransferase involved in cell wall biosynthesis